MLPSRSGISAEAISRKYYIVLEAVSQKCFQAKLSQETIRRKKKLKEMLL